MRKYLILLFAMAVCSNSLFAWGQAGHDAVAYIAECNLTPKAKANVEKYLGYSIVYFASWADKYRESKEYGFTSRWHGGRVDGELQSTEAVRSEKGDCVREVENSIERLKNYKNLDDSTVAVNIKFLIHLVGDMHCPTHVKYVGLKKYNVKLNGRVMSYHSVWDSGILNASHTWGYMEYQHQLDRYSQSEKQIISNGTPKEWFHQSAVDCKDIYEWAKADDELGKDFVNKTHRLAEQQIVKAGYRLARILNELFA